MKYHAVSFTITKRIVRMNIQIISSIFQSEPKAQKYFEKCQKQYPNVVWKKFEIDTEKPHFPVVFEKEAAYIPRINGTLTQIQATTNDGKPNKFRSYKKRS